MTTPTLRQPGTVHLSCRGDDDRWIVAHADPYIHIAGKVLDTVRAGKHHLNATLNGDVLTIRAANRTLIYRVRGKVNTWTGGDVYEAEWPD